MTEQQLHGACADFLTWALTSPETFWTTFPAGGGGYDRGRILKHLGLKAGVPDLFPIIYRGRAHGIELKTENGRVSEAQLSTHHKLIAAGVQVVVARSLDDVRAALSGWGIPTQEHKPASPLMAGLAKALRDID
jgi:VRR-NUC domain